MDINTCYELTKDVQTIASYTHYVPFIISFFLSFYLLVKTNHSLLSKIFFCFVLGINTWLLADLIAWISPDYNLIHSFWALFDYVNILFFLYGLYFFVVLMRKKDIEWQWKLFGLILTLPAVYLVITGNSVHEFDQTVCESVNDSLLSSYKNYIEAFVIASIIFFTGLIWWKKGSNTEKNQIYIVSLGLLLFFGTFAGADYFSVQTGIYEIGLYSLFILPIFLGLIVYAIVKYKAFNVALLGAQALVLALVVLVGAQFFFNQNITSQIFTAATLLLSMTFGYFLIRGVKRDIERRKQIEKIAEELKSTNTSLATANTRLQELDQQKTEFISLATHQIRGPLGAIKGHASLALEGDYGEINSGAKKAFETIMHSAQSLVVVVNDYLDVSRIEQGRMKYDLTNFDLKDLAKDVVNEQLPGIANKSLTLDFNCDQTQTYKVCADIGKIKQVFGNLIDNSIKYTPKGHIRVTLEKKEDKILFSIKDTGVGIKPEVLPNLFTKFSRAPDANKTNILGTGLGLYVAKKMIEAHNGRIWAESEGENKGSQFYIELQEAK